eukprot:2402151-Rhodomonas_salina.5
MKENERGNADHVECSVELFPRLLQALCHCLTAPETEPPSALPELGSKKSTDRNRTCVSTDRNGTNISTRHNIRTLSHPIRIRRSLSNADNLNQE